MEKIDLLVTLTANKEDSNNVTIAFTMGVKAAQKGYETVILLLSDAVHLAKKGYAETIDIGNPFRPIDELLSEFIAQGGKIRVCKACMVHNGVTEDSIIDGAEVVQADYVIDALMESKRQLQLN